MCPRGVRWCPPQDPGARDLPASCSASRHPVTRAPCEVRLYTCAKCGHVTYRLGTGALKIAKSCCVGHSFGGTARILGANWLLVPINGRLHWSLVLINSPGRPGSFMIHLDSCPGLHTAAFVADPLRAWLTCMVAERDGCSLDDAGLHIGTCRYVFCPAQKQPVGSVDCGLYLCAFASRFLSMVDGTPRRAAAAPRRLVLDPLFVSAGNEHVKHALQASDSKSNPATHQAAAAAARCLHGGAKRRSPPRTTLRRHCLHCRQCPREVALEYHAVRAGTGSSNAQGGGHGTAAVRDSMAHSVLPSCARFRRHLSALSILNPGAALRRFGSHCRKEACSTVCFRRWRTPGC